MINRHDISQASKRVAELSFNIDERACFKWFNFGLLQLFTVLGLTLNIRIIKLLLSPGARMV